MIPVILKVLFTVVLLTATLLASTLPLTIRACAQESGGKKDRRLYIVAIGLLSCYGGGVFVGTCLMELIPDAHTKVISGFTKLNLNMSNYPLPEFMICFGFILILLSEQIGVWFEAARRKPDPPVHKPSILSRGKMTFNIRANAKESISEQQRKTSNDPHLLSVRPAVGEDHDCCSFHCPADVEMSMVVPSVEPDTTPVSTVPSYDASIENQSQPGRKSTDPVIFDRAIFEEIEAKKNTVPDCNGVERPKAKLSYGSVASEKERSSISSIEQQPAAPSEHDELHFDPEGQSSFKAIMLVGALSLHSLFEGMALGLQDSSTSIASIFVAIIIHKSIIGFSIGLRLSRSNLSYIVVVICDAIFSFMSPLGSVTGILLSEQLSGGVGDLVNGMLTSVACGTFLYVTFFEIIPHELKGNDRKMMKMLVLVLGFATVAVLMFFTI